MFQDDHYGFFFNLPVGYSKDLIGLESASTCSDREDAVLEWMD